MDPLLLIVATPLYFLFGLLVFKVGRAMLNIHDVKQAIEDYEKSPESAGWIKRYFFGWIFPFQRKLMKSMANGPFKTLFHLWFKMGGIFFILMSFLAVASPFILWYLSATSRILQ